MAELVEIDSKRKPCCYCGQKADHPDYTCPRIESVEIDEAGVTVHFHLPDVWAKFCED